ncbi:MAG: phosphate ABC transporter substrate-binding protein PstS [Brevinema sp.]
MYKDLSKNIFVCILALATISCTQKIKFPSEKIIGSGSSFSLPMSDKLIKYYNRSYQQHISFTPNNSYQGIQDLIDGKVDFAISDVYLSDEEIEKNPDLIHIPVSVAGINFAYNIPNEGFSLYDDPVYLTPDIISDIYLGKITNWNDSQILAINKKSSETPNRVFPNLPITVIKRDSISGDTYLLTKFLTKASKTWANKIGTTNNLSHIKGIGASSALNIMKLVIDTPGAFAYSTMIYAIQNQIPLIRVRNSFGVYVRGCNFRSAEAMKASTSRPDNRVDLTYPTKNNQSAVAAGFNYIIIKKDLSYNNKTEAEAQTLINFIAWLLSIESQQQLDPIMFSPLTSEFRVSSIKALSSITYQGKPLIAQELIKKSK